MRCLSSLALLATALQGADAFALHAARLPQTPAAASRHAAPALVAEGPLAALKDAGDKLTGLIGQVVPSGQSQEPAKAAAGEEATDAAAEDDGKMTIDKIASFGIAGILSIAVAESVFWILSFPTSELLYYVSTGEWIDLTQQEGQIKFLAFTAGWGAVGGVIAQYRTVLTAAAMTPWMDRTVVKPYVNPFLEKIGQKPDETEIPDEL